MQELLLGNSASVNWCRDFGCERIGINRVRINDVSLRINRSGVCGSIADCVWREAL